MHIGIGYYVSETKETKETKGKNEYVKCSPGQQVGCHPARGAVKENNEREHLQKISNIHHSFSLCH